MKKIAIIILMLFISYAGFSQIIEINTGYSSGSYNKYWVCRSVGLGYKQLLSPRNRLGLQLNYQKCSADYDEIEQSLSDGVSYNINQVSPNNLRYSINLQYTYTIIDHSAAQLNVGAEVGLNFLIINEDLIRFENGAIDAGTFRNELKDKYRPGFGLIFEFEINNVINKNLSVVSNINPQLVSYHEIGLECSSSPAILGWMNFGLGIRYSFRKIANK
jgi:hypothetical protein